MEYVYVIHSETPASSPVILYLRRAEILQKITWKWGKNDSENHHHKWIQLVNTILGIVNKNKSWRCEFNISCQLWISASEYVRQIKSANKDEKYGCVVKFKVATAVCDSISCSSSYCVLQINSDLQCKNITTITANPKLLPKKWGYGRRTKVCHLSFNK